MSRGFVKEDDQEEVPIVPQRAHLPEGVTNFVTPFGMNQLLAEKQVLVNEKNNLNNNNENEIRFGATITLRIEASRNIQTFQIVGVDEANISKGKVSFISPIAKVSINKKIGDKVILKQAKKDIVFEIIDISYI